MASEDGARGLKAVRKVVGGSSLQGSRRDGGVGSLEEGGAGGVLPLAGEPDVGWMANTWEGGEGVGRGRERC